MYDAVALGRKLKILVITFQCQSGCWPKAIFTIMSWSIRGQTDKRPRPGECVNRTRSIYMYQYSNMAPRLSGENSIFGVVFFVSKSLLGIKRKKKLKKFTILTRKPRSHVRILKYGTWPINDNTLTWHVHVTVWIREVKLWHYSWGRVIIAPAYFAYAFYRHWFSCV